MPHSHHSHSGQFCAHATGTLESVVLEAIRQGFEVYGLTEHAPRYRVEDLYPEERESNLTPDGLATQFEAFMDEAHRLKAAYESQITLLVGLETEHITATDLDRLQELLNGLSPRIQYLVGSVHHVNGIPIDFDRPTYEKALWSCKDNDSLLEATPMTGFLSAYFDAQYELITRVQPEVIGHVDLCRLYDPTLRFEDHPAAWPKLERNVLFAVGYGALFEFNAAALRKGWEGSYPGEYVVRLIQRHGGRFCLSDDSHGPHAVGLNYHRMYAYLRRLDIGELWFLQLSDQPNAAGRFVRPVKMDGDWHEHPFWAGIPSV